MVFPTGLEPATYSLAYHYGFHHQISYLFVVWNTPSPSQVRYVYSLRIFETIFKVPYVHDDSRKLSYFLSLHEHSFLL